MNRLAIVVLNWNGAPDAIVCVKSLTENSSTTDIIIVDNNSSDDSVDILESFSKKIGNRVHLIKNSINSGYSGGNNVGLTYAIEKGYEYIGTLNPDATADAGWIENLTSELDSRPEVGIVTGILARSDRKHIDSTGEQYTTWGIPSPRSRDQTINKAHDKPQYIFASTGGGFIARVETLKTIGLFDERFFMYFEDVDLCFRAQLAGYKVLYTPNAIAYHKLSVSANKVPGLAVYNTFKNLPMLLWKNIPLGLMPTIIPRFLLTYCLILGNAIVNGRGWPALKGFMMSLYNTPHTLLERHRIQSTKKVSTDYIKSIIVHDIPPEQTGMRKFRQFFTGKS